ncbi:MAG: hypothetical protein COB53_07130 [Elusimicrobia bacterium]|nr:MAG: hypothetical protein COB53_07130 [Elusimicrobiota bacterium]
MEKQKSISSSFIKSLSISVVAALIVASPGPFATRAFAKVFGKAPTNVNAGTTVGTVVLPMLTSPALSNGNATSLVPGLGSSVLPTLNAPTFTPNITVAPQATVSRKSAIISEKAVEIAPAASVGITINDGVAAAAKEQPVSLRESLSNSVAAIKEAKSPSAAHVALSNLFTGSRKTARQDTVLGNIGRVTRSLLSPAQSLNAADSAQDAKENEVPPPGVANDTFLNSRTNKQIAGLVDEYKRIDDGGLWDDAKETKRFVKELTWFVARGRDKDESPELAMESIENAFAIAKVSNVDAVRDRLISLNDRTELGLTRREASGQTYITAEGVDDDGFTPIQKKGLFGMLWSRPFGMLGFSLSAMAYPLMLIDTVGKSQMYELFSLGGVISIGINLIVGKIGDHLPLKKYIVFNALLRSALSAANAVLYSMGYLNFWSLLFLTVINAWQFASLFITDDAMMAEIVGPNRKKIFSTSILIRTMGLFVTIGSGIFLGSFVVDGLGFVATFSIVTVAAAIPALILWGALPNIGVKDGNAPLGSVLAKLPGVIARAPAKAWKAILGLPWKKYFARALTLTGLGGTAAAFYFGMPLLGTVLTTGTAIAAGTAVAVVASGMVMLANKLMKAHKAEQSGEPVEDKEGDGVRTILANIAIITGALAGYLFLYQTPFWMVGAVTYILVRSSIFKNVIMKHGLLKMALLMVIATTFVEVPLRNAVLGALSEELVGEAGKAAFYGKLIAAFTLGQLVTATGNLSKSLDIVIKKIGFFKLKNPWSINLYKTTRWLGAAVLAAWGMYFIVPMGWLTTIAPAVAILWPLALLTAAVIALMGLRPYYKGTNPPSAAMIRIVIASTIIALALPIILLAIGMMPTMASTALGLAIAGAAFYKFYQKVHDNAKAVKASTWLRLEAVGLVAIGVLPLVTGFNPVALYASLFLFGMTHTPAKYNIGSAYSATAKEVDDKNYQFLSAIKGTFVVMAGSIAYAIYGLAKDIPEMLWNNSNAFPFTWQVLAVIYGAIAALYLYSSRNMDFDGKKKDAKAAKK